MDVGEPLGCDELLGVLLRLGDVRALDDHVRAELAAARLLDERRHLRHHHRHGNAEVAPVPRERERMVARACRDHALRAGRRRKLQQRVARAALLEAAGALLVLELREDGRAGDARERGRLDARRSKHATRDARTRRDDVVDGHVRRGGVCALRAHAPAFTVAGDFGSTFPAAFAASSAFSRRST